MLGCGVVKGGKGRGQVGDMEVVEVGKWKSCRRAGQLREVQGSSHKQHKAFFILDLGDKHNRVLDKFYEAFYSTAS